MCTVLLPTAVSPISINIYIYIYIYTHTYYYYYYSDRNMAMGLTKPLTENSTRNIFWGKGGRYVGLTSVPPSDGDGKLGFHPSHSARLWRWGQLYTPAALIPKEIAWHSFLWDAERAPGLPNAAEGIGYWKISKDPTGVRTRNLPPCGTVLNELPRSSPVSIVFNHYFILRA